MRMSTLRTPEGAKTIVGAVLASSLAWSAVWGLICLNFGPSADFESIIFLVFAGFCPPLLGLTLYRLAHLGIPEDGYLHPLLTHYLAWGVLWTLALIVFELFGHGVSDTVTVIASAAIILFGPPLIGWAGFRAVTAVYRAHQVAAKRRLMVRR